MLDGVRVAALPPELVNLGDAPRQRAGNGSYAGSHRCSAIAARNITIMCCSTSFRSSHTSRQRALHGFVEGSVKRGCHTATGHTEVRPVAVTAPLAAPGRSG